MNTKQWRSEWVCRT